MIILMKYIYDKLYSSKYETIFKKLLLYLVEYMKIFFHCFFFWYGEEMSFFFKQLQPDFFLLKVKAIIFVTIKDFLQLLSIVYARLTSVTPNICYYLISNLLQSFNKLYS